MVDNQHWLDRWSENRIGFHEGQVNRFLVEFLPRLELPPGAGVFVPLCGKAVDLVWLAEQGFNVLGIELSSIAIEAFFEEQGLEFERREGERFVYFQSGGITLLQGDFFDLAAADVSHCALVYDRAALIAMENPLRQEYYRHMLSIAVAIRQMLLITLAYDQAEMRGPPFAVADDEVLREYGAAFAIERLAQQDTLDESPRWRKAGLTALKESAFRLDRRSQ